MNGSIVYAGGTRYDGVSGTDRHMADRLSTLADVLYVDPPRPLRSGLRDPETGEAGHVLRRVAPRLWRLSPVAPPAAYRPGVDRVTAALARRAVRAAARKLGLGIGAVVVAGTTDLLDVRPGARTVRYITDDLVAGASLIRMSAARLAQTEARMTRRADAVAVVSPGLVEQVARMGRDAALVPNGCDVSAYAAIDHAPPPTDLPPGLASTPVAGFVGHINARIDIALLEAVADTGVPLVLVGPRSGDYEPERWPALIGRANVHWVGRKPYDELPSYLRLVDVGLTPYTDTAFNRASFPLKTLEYLAAGRGVVSTDLPATAWLEAGPLIPVARTPAEYAATVAAQLRIPRTPALAERRRAFAARHDWNQRVRLLADILGIEIREVAGR
ncbi:glycosyltransferase [Sphaerisporangium album]|uniref:Glycosyltransferase n=1 Tax=Sphaerisporangium album TaxID=509200 RepID=A0A367FMC8_9ACTN|nr:glycosyltransferase [Sphaerisporangium album]RCG31538.1 glycosyltransferase [Sphaerisporangium album]